MGRPKSRKLWENLPDLILITILDYLPDTRSILAASAVCKRWRYLVLEKVFKREQVVEFSCRKTIWGKSRNRYDWVQKEVCMTKDDIQMVLRFLPNIHTLVFQWCVCKTEKLLKALEEIVEQSEEIKVKKIKIKGNIERGLFGSCQRVRLLQDGRNWKFELFYTLLERCTKLEVLDLGFEPDLSRIGSLLPYVVCKIGTGSGKLQALNMAVIYNESVDCSLIAGQLCKLSTLCLTWDKHFVDFIHVLSSMSDSDTNLKDLIVTVTEQLASIPYVTNEQWASLELNQPKLKLKLVIADNLFPFCYQNYVQVLYGQLANATVPVKKLTYISRIPHDGHFHSWANTIDQVEELSWICVTEQANAYGGLFFLGTVCQFTHLEKLEFYGIHLRDKTVLDIVSKLGRRLREFVVSEKDISYSRCTSSHAKKFEESVTAGLGKKWQPLTHTGKESLRIIISTHSNDWPIVVEKMERVLQDTCDTPHL